MKQFIHYTIMLLMLVAFVLADVAMADPITQVGDPNHAFVTSGCKDLSQQAKAAKSQIQLHESKYGSRAQGSPMFRNTWISYVVESHRVAPIAGLEASIKVREERNLYQQRAQASMKKYNENISVLKAAQRQWQSKNCSVLADQFIGGGASIFSFDSYSPPYAAPSLRQGLAPFSSETSPFYEEEGDPEVLRPHHAFQWGASTNAQNNNNAQNAGAQSNNFQNKFVPSFYLQNENGPTYKTPSDLPDSWK